MTDRAPHHRITVDEYYRMAEDGKLDPDARVELIEGEIIEMAPIGSRHGASSTKLAYLLMRSLGDSALVRVQLPLRLDNYSEPEPDLAVAVPRTDFYKECHPTPADVLLLIEVSDSSSSRDRTAEVSLYARHNVPEVWIVDLQRERLHFYRTPREGAYTDVSFTAKPGVIALAAPLGITVDLSGLFES
jgi:Uma2 family endonuclease